MLPLASKANSLLALAVASSVNVGFVIVVVLDPLIDLSNSSGAVAP